MVAEARRSKGMDTSRPPSMNALPSPSSGTSKQQIIEKKPKHKVLKEHFESLIQAICDEEDT